MLIHTHFFPTGLQRTSSLSCGRMNIIMPALIVNYSCRASSYQQVISAEMSILGRCWWDGDGGGGRETVPGWGVTIHHMLPLSVRWKQYTCIALHVEVSGLLHSVLVRLKFSVRSTSATSWKSWYEALINSVLLRVIRSDSDLYVSDKQLNLNNFLWSSSEDKLRSLTAWGKEAGL